VPLVAVAAVDDEKTEIEELLPAEFLLGAAGDGGNVHFPGLAQAHERAHGSAVGIPRGVVELAAFACRAVEHGARPGVVLFGGIEPIRMQLDPLIERVPA
jgi:hypothetical protein